ncbi:MAG TPA: CBS domain-containing protein [Candidatus Nitrosotenuis sp.]|nr:CBS domain-containing protein [Candidatus Nitrosotenuis sp.]
MSAFEMQKRLKENNSKVRAIHEREIALPRLRGVVKLLSILFSVLLTGTLVFILSWWLGVLVAIAALLGQVLLSKNIKIQTYTQKKLVLYESRLIVFVGKYKWLEWFAPVMSKRIDRSISSKDELVDIINRSNGILDTDQKRHLRSSLSFEDILVSDVMTPKSMIDSIDISDGTGPLVMDALHKTGHSRFPVIDENIDHVVGMLYLHDLITLQMSHRSVKDAMRQEVFYIREDQNLKHAMHAFLRTHHHLFIVVNTFRETVGLLSLEDVVEAMLGSQIIDEFDEFHDLRKVAETNPRANNEPKGRTDI